MLFYGQFNLPPPLDTFRNYSLDTPWPLITMPVYVSITGFVSPQSPTKFVLECIIYTRACIVVFTGLGTHIMFMENAWVRMMFSTCSPAQKCQCAPPPLPHAHFLTWENGKACIFNFNLWHNVEGLAKHNS